MWKVPLYIAIGFLLSAVLHSILTASPSSDGALFLSVGRAVLNGRVPYRDLFETKPPAIFYLSSFAQILGGEVAARIFSALAILGIFYACLKNHYGMIIGVILACMTAAFGGRYYTEIFGASFLCLAIRFYPKWWCVIFVFLALFMKETMLLPAIAVGLLIARNDWKRWAMILAGSLLLFLFSLIALRLLDEYLTIYLPFMLFVRVGGAENAGIGYALKDIVFFSPPLILLLFSCLWYKRSLKGYILDCLVVLLIIGTCLMGRYSPSHATAAIPVYMALCINKESKRNLILAITTLLFIPVSGNFWLQTFNSWEPVRKEATALDEIMNSCEYNRYFYVGGSSPILALTKHSPEGPLLYMEMFMLQNPYLVDETLSRLKKTDIILFEKKTSALSIEKEFLNYIQIEAEENFTLVPPPCAGGTYKSNKFVLMFRSR